MIILADIGGTKTRIAISDGHRFDEPRVIDTPQSYGEALKGITESAKDMLAGRIPDVAMIGVAGTLSPDKKTLLRAPHLKDWQDKQIAKDFREKLSVPVHFENDAALGALGEAVAGAGRDASILAYITVGTGVGGARIVHKRIDATALGFEIGHQYLVTGEKAHEVEQLVSGSALLARYGTHPKEITDPAVWDETAKVFAYALFNTIVHWSPDTVVLGGSMFNMPGINIEAVKLHLKEIGTSFAILPVIKKAELGQLGGLYGAQAQVPFIHT